MIGLSKGNGTTSATMPRSAAASTHPQVLVNRERCAGCQDCLIRCPTEALSLDPIDWVVQADDARCVGCRQCVRVCAFSAIQVEGPRLVAASHPAQTFHPSTIIGDTREIRTGFASWKEAAVEADRCLNCPDPTCARGCPAHNNIPGFIAALREQDLDKAHAILRETSVLPDICSRVCDWNRQCEGACSWKLAGEQPVAIGRLERFVTEQQAVPALKRAPSADAPFSAVIVGSGPAGIAAAWELLAAGAEVTMLEKDLEPGGVLRWGIPSYVLPDDVVRRPFSALQEAGLHLELGVQLGRDVNLDTLLAEHDVVILAHGASVPSKLRATGADLDGVEDATTFLTRGKRALQDGLALVDLPKGSCILVVGAGNTAMDAARTALRLGIKAVAVEWMDERFANVRPDELVEAREEGVDIRFTTTVERLDGDDKGFVKAALLRRTQQTKAGTLPKVLPGSPEQLPIDRVVVATGYRVDASVAGERAPNLPLPRPDLSQTIPDRRWLASGILSTASPVGLQALARDVLLTQATVARSDRVWVAGDALAGPSTVVSSMAHGREAARAILRHEVSQTTWQ